MSDELKPCPFCGSRAEVIECDDPVNRGGYTVECKGCWASTRVHFDGGKGADVRAIVIEAWNLRAAVKERGEDTKVVELLKVAVCPACDGSGAIQVPVGEHFVSHEMAIDAGDSSMEGQSMGIEYEVQQCQWCDERKQLLDAAMQQQSGGKS